MPGARARQRVRDAGDVQLERALHPAGRGGQRAQRAREREGAVRHAAAASREWSAEAESHRLVRADDAVGLFHGRDGARRGVAIGQRDVPRPDPARRHREVALRAHGPAQQAHIEIVPVVVTDRERVATRRAGPGRDVAEGQLAVHDVGALRVADQLGHRVEGRQAVAGRAVREPRAIGQLVDRGREPPGTQQRVVADDQVVVDEERKVAEGMTRPTAAVLVVMLTDVGLVDLGRADGRLVGRPTGGRHEVGRSQHAGECDQDQDSTVSREPESRHVCLLESERDPFARFSGPGINVSSSRRQRRRVSKAATIACACHARRAAAAAGSEKNSGDTAADEEASGFGLGATNSSRALSYGAALRALHSVTMLSTSRTPSRVAGPSSVLALTLAISAFSATSCSLTWASVGRRERSARTRSTFRSSSRAGGNTETPSR